MNLEEWRGYVPDALIDAQTMEDLKQYLACKHMDVAAHELKASQEHQDVLLALSEVHDGLCLACNALGKLLKQVK